MSSKKQMKRAEHERQLLLARDQQFKLRQDDIIECARDLLLSGLPNEEVAAVMMTSHLRRRAVVVTNGGGDDDDDDGQAAGNKKKQTTTIYEGSSAMHDGGCFAPSGSWFDDAQERAVHFLDTHGGLDFLEEAARRFESFEEGDDDVDEDEDEKEEEKEEQQTQDNTENFQQQQTNKEPAHLPQPRSTTVQFAAHDDDDEGEDARGGMLLARSNDMFDAFSRSRSDIDAESDEWVLSKILLKRKISRTLLSPDDYEADDLDDDEDDDGTLLKGGSKKGAASSATAKKVTQYLCQWEGYDEPTWEFASLLERKGFGDEVVAFEKQQATKTAGAAVASSSSSSSPSSGGPGNRERRFGPLTGRIKRSFRKTLFEEIFPDWQEFILKSFGEYRYRVVSISNVAPPHPSAQFLRHWKKCNATVAPQRTFHGSKSKYIPAIIANGLAIPGTRGVEVRHANAFGCGTYTAKSVETPTSYADENCLIFVCAVLVGKDYETLDHKDFLDPEDGFYCPEDFVIVRENHLVVPVWLVHFEQLDKEEWNWDTFERKYFINRKPIPPPRLFASWQEQVARIRLTGEKEWSDDSDTEKVDTNPDNVKVYVPQDARTDVEQLNPRQGQVRAVVDRAQVRLSMIKRGFDSKLFDKSHCKMVRQLPRAAKKVVLQK